MILYQLFFRNLFHHKICQNIPSFYHKNLFKDANWDLNRHIRIINIITDTVKILPVSLVWVQKLVIGFPPIDDIKKVILEVIFPRWAFLTLIMFILFLVIEIDAFLMIPDLAITALNPCSFSETADAGLQLMRGCFNSDWRLIFFVFIKYNLI